MEIFKSVRVLSVNRLIAQEKRNPKGVNVDGLFVAASDGSEWDSRVSKNYIIFNGKEGSFVLI